MNTLVRYQKQQTTSKKAGDLLNEIDQLELAMTKLSESLADVNQYVQKVVSGKEKGDAKIGRILSEAIESVPKLSSEQFDKDFNEHLQDLLMVIYLSNLMRTQLSIAEKLTTAL